jgi:hypothetical protein
MNEFSTLSRKEKLNQERMRNLTEIWREEKKFLSILDKLEVETPDDVVEKLSCTLKTMMLTRLN